MTRQEQKIIDRIRKIMAKAESTNNAAEAEMLMAKVNALLTEHNYSLLDIETAHSDDPIGTDKYFATHLVNDSWYGHVVSSLARYYGCKCVVTTLTKNKKAYSMSGRESARVTVQLMAPFVRSQILAQAREMAESDPITYRNPRIAARRVANALVFRIQKLVRENEAREEERVASGQNALVPVDLIDAERERAFPNIPTVRPVGIRTDSNARKRAEGISLYQQTTGEDQKKIA